MQLRLIDDQTHATRHAIGVMESNAVFGLFAVLAMCWIFLGSRLSVLVGWACRSRSPAPSSRDLIGSTLNLTVLLGW